MTMQGPLRSFLLAGATLLALAAFCQTPPYPVTITGQVPGCTPGSSLNIGTLFGTEPSLNIDVPLDPGTCGFSVTMQMDSTAGWFLVSTPCQGAMLSDTLHYTVNSFFPDSTVISVVLNCGGSGGTCQSTFAVQQATNSSGLLVPWQIATTNQSTGNGTLSYSWWMPDGSTSTAFEPGYTFTQAGVYGICLSISNADSSCTDWHCDTVVVDTNGFISASPVWYDCLGTLWGPNTPGTACDDGNPMTDSTYWNVNCACVAGGLLIDCFGNPGGSALPGTPCTVPGTTLAGLWTSDCVCVVDSCTACINIQQTAPFSGLFTSCTTGTAGGDTYLWNFSDTGNQPGWSVSHTFAGPGTYTVCLNVTDSLGSCSTCDTVVVDSDGTINPLPLTPCEAGFWAIQAYDSTADGVIEPIPNEVWVWNLSSGGNGTYQFFWDFGDGTSSTDAFPSHAYDGPGPWLLCLIMTSGDPMNGGCTDSYCDSLSMDANGMLNGMMVHGHGAVSGITASDRSGGFTLNVIQGTPSGIAELPAITELRVWPNPVGDLLNISLHSSQRRAVPVAVIGPAGQMVLSGTCTLGSGEDVLRLPVEKLPQGLYMVRIGDGMHSRTKRFLKVNP